VQCLSVSAIFISRVFVSFPASQLNRAAMIWCVAALSSYYKVLGLVQSQTHIRNPRDLLLVR
jgi:hypothetical protein